jgi:hypothetical protein
MGVSSFWQLSRSGKGAFTKGRGGVLCSVTGWVQDLEYESKCGGSPAGKKRPLCLGWQGFLVDET